MGYEWPHLNAASRSSRGERARPGWARGEFWAGVLQAALGL